MQFLLYSNLHVLFGIFSLISFVQESAFYEAVEFVTVEITVVCMISMDSILSHLPPPFCGYCISAAAL